MNPAGALADSNGTGEKLINAMLAVITAFFVAEVTEMNRATRIWLHGGRIFWGYEAIFALLMLAAGLRIAAYVRSAGWNRRKWLASGAVLGFFGGFVALLCVSITARGRPAAASLVRDAALFSFYTLSWAIGIVWGASLWALSRRKHKVLLTIIVGALGIRVIETIAHLALHERLF